MRLVLALSLMLQPPSEEAAQAVFNAGDYAKALEMYLDLAKEPGARLPDAFSGAHDSLLGLFMVTGDGAHLCRARDLARELLARDVFADGDERRAWQELEAADRARIAETSTSCAPEPARAPGQPAAEGPAPAPASPPAPVRRPRGRSAGGGVLLAAGAGLAAGTVASLVLRARADAEIQRLDGIIEPAVREPTAEEAAAVAGADRRYVQMTQVAVGLGVAAGAAIAAGIALLAAPARRRPALGRLRVAPGGLDVSF